MKYINLFFFLSVLAPMAVRADGASDIGATVVPFQRIYDAVKTRPQLYDSDFVFLLGERVTDNIYTLQKVAQACIDYTAYNNAVTKAICTGFVAAAFGPSDVATESGGSVTDGVILTTTNMSAGTEIKITIHAAGQFNVDCNNDGLVEWVINNPDIVEKDIECKYDADGSHEIKITGRATDYPEYAVVDGVIYFNKSPYLKYVRGSLGSIFPTLGDVKRPIFGYTFVDCINLTEISADLFSSVTGAAEGMFEGTFWGCTGLRKIPDGLFSGVSGVADGMFYGTFSDCTNLTKIPDGLFYGVSGAAAEMFAGTFQGCTNLTEIPANLFDGVTGTAVDMFGDTFYDVSPDVVPDAVKQKMTQCNIPPDGE